MEQSPKRVDVGASCVQRNVNLYLTLNGTEDICTKM